MTALKITLQVIVVLLSFVLTLLILMHKGQGVGGLSDMFGGGLTQNAGTSGVDRKEPEPLDRYHRSGVGGLDHRPRHDDQVQPRLIGLHAI